LRVFTAQINPIVGDLDGNTEKILKAIQRAKKAKADVVLFPELTLCGYPPEDLLFSPLFVQTMHEKLLLIQKETEGLFVVVGLARKNPLEKEKALYNSAAILCDGKLLGYKDKTLLPTYDIFDERRYFEPGEGQKVFEYKGKRIGILICEDMWQHGGGVLFTNYLRDPVLEIKEQNPDLLLNMSASPYYFAKRDFREYVFAPCAKTLDCPIIWCNQVGANDSLVFDGFSLYMDKNGHLLQSAKGFEEDDMITDLEKEICSTSFPYDPLGDLYHTLILGIKDYFRKQGFKKAIIGSSGGVDSAAVICLAVAALGKENVLTVAMPSKYSSESSITDAKKLAENLDVEMITIPINEPFQEFKDLLNPFFEGKKEDVTEENMQARIRGIIIMALSNKFGHIVLSTGNKSEMALGYSTLYGDMCGGLGVINDVKKTLLYDLCRWINEFREGPIPENILTKAPSAELRPDQKDLDSLPEYDIVDTVLEEYVENCLSVEKIHEKHGIEKALVQDLVHRIHLAEYKRRQAAPGIRVSKRSFSKGRIFPIVQRWN